MKLKEKNINKYIESISKEKNITSSFLKKHPNINNEEFSNHFYNYFGDEFNIVNTHISDNDLIITSINKDDKLKSYLTTTKYNGTNKNEFEVIKQIDFEEQPNFFENLNDKYISYPFIENDNSKVVIYKQIDEQWEEDFILFETDEYKIKNPKLINFDNKWILVFISISNKYKFNNKVCIQVFEKIEFENKKVHIKSDLQILNELNTVIDYSLIHQSNDTLIMFNNYSNNQQWLSFTYQLRLSNDLVILDRSSLTQSVRTDKIDQITKNDKSIEIFSSNTNKNFVATICDDLTITYFNENLEVKNQQSNITNIFNIVIESFRIFIDNGIIEIIVNNGEKILNEYIKVNNTIKFESNIDNVRIYKLKEK